LVATVRSLCLDLAVTTMEPKLVHLTTIQY